MKQLGETLKRLRQKSRLRQEDVATMVGVERSTVANWERGVKQPSLDTLLRLSEIFGVSLDELVGATRATTPLPLACYCSLAADPLVKLLGERTGVPAKSIAAFIAALQLSEDVRGNCRKKSLKGESDNHN